MRSRNIKPGFFTNELLGTYDPIISLMFAGLWCLADKEGILEDRPLRIKAELFPYREGLDINGYLTVMERDGFLKRYEVNGKRYIMIENFNKHQTPHHTEKPKGYPRPIQETQDQQSKDVLTPLDNGECKVPTRSDSLIPDSLIPDSKPTSPSDKPDDGFGEFWKAYPKRKAKGDALKAWAKLKDKRNTLTLILGALAWQTKTLDWTKDGGQFIPYPASYLNSQSWLDEPTGTPSPAIPFDREAYEAKRKAERAAAREAYQRQEEAATVPVARSAP